jgi:hypothetical protein
MKKSSTEKKTLSLVTRIVRTLADGDLVYVAGGGRKAGASYDCPPPPTAYCE